MSRGKMATKEISSQWRLVWRGFRKHKVAMISLCILGAFYLVALSAPLIAPYDPNQDFYSEGYLNAPPQARHLFGTDGMGRDLFTRVLYGSRISLSVGFLGIAISTILALIIGGISGYFGGVVDEAIQRVLDFLNSVPSFPLWMALSAALPRSMGSTARYFMITVILSLYMWCGMARVIRGKILALRSEDYVMAARVSGAGTWAVVWRHLVPAMSSYTIATVTLAIPTVILGETSLSFIGLGIQAPAISWGVLLSDAHSLVAIVKTPWLLIPCMFVIISVLAFNFVGDGLRDAADPYQ